MATVLMVQRLFCRGLLTVSCVLGALTVLGPMELIAQELSPEPLHVAEPLSVDDTPRVVTNLTRGMRISGVHLSIAQAPSNPKVLYMGTTHGRVYSSADGGISWEEAAVLTKRDRYVGSIKAAKPMKGILDRWITPTPISSTRVGGVSLESSASAIRSTDGGDIGTRTSGDLQPGDALVRELTGIESAGRSSAAGQLKDTYGGLVDAPASGGDGANTAADNNLAIGIRARAPWLAYMVRRKRGWGLGISLQQNLVLKSGAGTSIHHLDVHPSRPGDILAATTDGLRRSRDNGYSWPLILTGASQPERIINHVTRSPFDQSVIYVATKRGLRVSSDDGETFQKMLNRWVVSMDIRWVELDPTRRGVMYVGATYGLFKSVDSGRNFSVVHRSPWPDLSLVRQVVIDPMEPARVWLGTADGLLVSRDDGKRFERAGGLLFTGSDIRRIAFGSKPGHVIVGTVRDLWESYDAGVTWQVAYFGPIQWDVRNLISDKSRAGDFLILTTGEVLKFGAGRSTPARPEHVTEFRKRRAKEPSADDAVATALKRAGVYRPELRAFRRGSRLRGLVPKVEAALRWATFSGDRAFANTFYDSDPIRLRGANSIPFMVSATAKWKLEYLIYSGAESIGRRLGRQNRYAEWRFTRTVITLHQERSRLLFEALSAPGDPRTRLMRDLRLEELTAHLNQLTGNMFEPYQAL